MDQLAILDDKYDFQFPKTNNINEWVFEMINPYLKGRILEIESGIESLSSVFIENGIALHLSNSDIGTRQILREKFKENSLIKSIHKIDLRCENFEQAYGAIFGAFDTLIALNIAENTHLDQKSVINARLLLRKQGHLITVTPAQTTLYYDFREHWDDLDKYNKKCIKHLLNDNLEILKTWYFNTSKSIHNVKLNYKGLYVIVLAQK
jgi:hypothetical protein